MDNPLERTAPQFLDHFFRDASARHPDMLALEIPPGDGRPQRETWTFSELETQVDAWRAEFAALGIGRGDIVAVWCSRANVDAFTAPVAALECGAAWVSIDPSFPDGHVARIVADSRPAALVTDLSTKARRETAAPGIRVVEIGDRETEPRPDLPAATDRQPADPAYLIYTSGTTGLPKGVVVPHAGIANLIRADLDFFDLGPGDRVLQGSSHSYDSSVEEIWMAWSAGAAVVAMDDNANRLGPDLAGWLREQRITVACPPPTLLRSMDPEAAATLPDLRLLYVGGEALTDDVVGVWAPGRSLVNGYGPTEVSVTSLRTPVAAGDPVTIGVPVDGLSAWVVDDALEPVAGGVEGELVIGGPGVALGYRNNPDATAQKFVEHPRLGRVYRTGDAAVRGADGKFSCLGRIDAQVKLRGFRIELEAIEAELARLAGVREAACRVTGDPGCEEIAAWMVPTDPGCRPEFSVLRDALAERLPLYMVPARYGWIDSLPRSTGGKLQRGALPEAGAVPAGGERDIVRPVDELESWLVECAAAVLGLGAETISTDADFFLDLGGTSLLAARWVSRLRSNTRTAAATVRDVYAHRTVAALAGSLRETTGNVDSELSGDMALGGAAGTGLKSEIETGVRLAPPAVAVAQALWLLLETVLETGAAVLWIAGPLAEALGNPKATGIGSAAWLLGTGIGLALVWAGWRIAEAVLLKKLLVRRWREGDVPVWSAQGLRQWVVVHAVRRIPWGLLEGTEGAAVVLRWLGARIGRRVHFHRGCLPLDGGWDLLEIGDDAVLCQDSAVRVVELVRGCRVAARVRVGARAVVGIRGTLCGGSSLGDGSILGPLSALAGGSTTGRDEAWDGIPAVHTGTVEPLPGGAAQGWGAGRWMVARGVSGLLVGAWTGLPAVWIGVWSLGRAGLSGRNWSEWLLDTGAGDAPAALALAAVLAVVPTLAASGLLARWLGNIPDGWHPLRSATGLRIWWTTALVDSASRWLSGSLFWPWWLRLAGMRIGPNCEISTLVDLLPRSVSMERDVFCADGIYLGCPEMRGGRVRTGKVEIGHDSFFGNHAVVRPGTCLPPDILLGVCTVADSSRIREGSSWFGLPAFELPRREVVEVDRSLTHSPGPARYATRLFWETLRLGLPAFPAWIWSGWAAAVAVSRWSSWGGMGAALAAAGVLLPVVPAAAVLALKWILLGKVRPGTHPLWSCWCSRWDFLYVAWTEWALPALSPLEGTLWLNGFLRAMGMKIGRRVVLSGGFSQVVDPDMIAIGDDATVSAIFQAHTFEDRVLKIDRVTVGAGATLGHGTVPLYGASIGERAQVGANSVVMKDEVLLPGLVHNGAPTRAEGPAGQF